MKTSRGRRLPARPLANLAGLAILAAAGLAGCGQESDDRASDPATGSDEPTSSESSPTTPSPSEPTESSEATETPEGAGAPIRVTGNAGVTTALVVDGTDAGGRQETLASPLTTEQERADFVAQFDGGFGETVLDALAALDAPAGSLPYGVVAAIGCDQPTSVEIVAGEAGYQVTPQLPKKTVQCFAPVTFVVLFAAPTG